eukprot:6747289-Heterocapsa_arctica.AAC.1
MYFSPARSSASATHPGASMAPLPRQVEAEPPTASIAAFMIASFNVCTMKEEQEGVRSRGSAGRAAILR